MPTAVPPIGFSATMTLDGTALHFPVSFDVSTGEVSTVDVSYMGMPTRDRLYIPGLQDGGTLTGETLYCEADWRLIWGKRGSTTPTAVVVTFPDDGTGTPPTYSFNAIMTKAPMKLEMEAVPHISFEFKVTGAITVG